MEPLITHPTGIFLVMLLVILLAPIVLRRLRIPHIIGLILAGVALGEHGLNVLARDASFELFGEVGIYYIMFLAGLEMDMGSFRRYGRGGLMFGALTFAIPFLIGFAVARSVLHFGGSTSVLLGCLLGSHTLVAFPIIGRYGLGKHRSVVHAIVATAFASFMALLTLAIVVQIRQGVGGWWFWLKFFIGIAVYMVSVAYVFPKVGRWFLRRNEDAVTQFVFVLSMVFISAWLAELVGLEGLLGAFFGGLILNRIIPHGGPLMGRLEFVGNALFVPWFLIGVGMLIDISVVTDRSTLWLCLVVVVTAIASKWIAALIMNKFTGGQRADRLILFGLTNAHAAGALAIVMIATAPAVQLMDAQMLNATVLLILVSCIVSSLATGRGARQIAVETNELERNRGSYHGKCLTAYAYPQTVDALTQLSIMIRNPLIADSLMGLAISMDDDPDDALRARGQHNLEKARETAAGAGVTMSTMSRVSSNVASAIVHTMREVDAGEVILGLHETADGQPAGKLGVIAQSVLASTHREVLLVRLLMPPGTMRRIIAAVPPKAEYEVGFYKWLEHLCRIGEQTGQQMVFHTCGDTGFYIKGYLAEHHPNVQMDVEVEKGFGSMLLSLPSIVAHDDLFIIVSSRAGFISFTPALNTLPAIIARHFAHTNIILLFPDQYGDPQESLSVFAPNGQSVTQRQMLFEEWLNKLRS
ncbi:MAG: cation:proton antiporter [Bacteroidaceae bacterium]|nr:cation:proton antiporter [Bacteroidaceae bacterium]